MERIINTQFTRIIVLVALCVIVVGFFMGKMSGTEVVTGFGLIFVNYVAKRMNEKYQDAKN